MREKNWGMLGRREILKTSAMALGGALLADPLEAYPKAVNTNSSPSTLKITDLRMATIVKPGPSPCPIIRIDTNQGVYGLGEVRDGASPTYALFLKSRIVGCVFASRCPLATELCRQVAPPLEEKASGHVAACHYAQREEIAA